MRYKTTAERGYTAAYPPPIPSLPDLARFPGCRAASIDPLVKAQPSQPTWRKQSQAPGEEGVGRKTSFVEHLKENDRLLRRMSDGTGAKLRRRASLWRFVRRKRDG
jgi:hypothetical protein